VEIGGEYASLAYGGMDAHASIKTALLSVSVQVFT